MLSRFSAQSLKPLAAAVLLVNLSTVTAYAQGSTETKPGNPAPPSVKTSDVSPKEAAELRKVLGERIPQLQHIDEIRTTPMKGLYEVRMGTDLFYTNENGNFLIQGELFDTRAKRNLTEDRIRELTAIDYDKLPFKDSFTVVRGNGKRQMAVFEDPNCGYCKRFEHNLAAVDNVTVHVFLYPILSPDSVEKARDIWCSKDPAETWTNWMVNDQTPPSQPECKKLGPLERNLAFGRQYKITGTPTIVFEDNTRVPGALSTAQIEQKLEQLATAPAKPS